MARAVDRSRRCCVALALACGGCLVTEVDLRTAPPAGGDAACGWRERFDAAAGECRPCTYRLPHPIDGCPCAWRYLPAPLPYCDAPEAYYECLPCAGDIESCNAYDRESGTGRDCALLGRCCAELAVAPGATPCCAAGEALACVLDPVASQGSLVFRLDCLPDPCCVGGPCPNGSGDCAAWQSCSAGVCTPACEPGVSECQVVLGRDGLACLCVEVVTPP